MISGRWMQSFLIVVTFVFHAVTGAVRTIPALLLLLLLIVVIVVVVGVIVRD